MICKLIDGGKTHAVRNIAGNRDEREGHVIGPDDRRQRRVWVDNGERAQRLTQKNEGKGKRTNGHVAGRWKVAPRGKEQY